MNKCFRLCPYRKVNNFRVVSHPQVTYNSVQNPVFLLPICSSMNSWMLNTLKLHWSSTQIQEVFLSSVWYCYSSLCQDQELSPLTWFSSDLHIWPNHIPWSFQFPYFTTGVPQGSGLGSVLFINHKVHRSDLKLLLVLDNWWHTTFIHFSFLHLPAVSEDVRLTSIPE